MLLHEKEYVEVIVEKQLPPLSNIIDFYYKTVILFYKQTCYNLINKKNYILDFSVYTKVEKGVLYERSVKNREFKEILCGKYKYNKS